MVGSFVLQRQSARQLLAEERDLLLFEISPVLLVDEYEIQEVLDGKLVIDIPKRWGERIKAAKEQTDGDGLSCQSRARVVHTAHVTVATCCHMVPHGATRCHMVPHGATWCHMVPRISSHTPTAEGSARANTPRTGAPSMISNFATVSFSL